MTSTPAPGLVAVGAAALLTAVLIAVFRRFAAPRAAAIAGGPGGLGALGMTSCTVGVFGLSAVGFGGLLDGKTAIMIVMPVSAPLTVGMVAVGAIVLRAARDRSSAAGSR